MLAVIGIGVREISGGQMPLGQLLAFAALLSYLYPHIRGLAQLGLLVTAATAGAERLIEVLDAPARCHRPDGPRAHRDRAARRQRRGAGCLLPLPRRRHHGTRRAVVHRAPGRTGDRHRPERRRQVHPLQAPAAVLRPRLRRGPPGRHPAERLPPPGPAARVHRPAAAGDPGLHDTVRANIACGRPGARDHAIEEAARTAGAHDFITALPDGYDTHVDPNSARLSGGQLQRLAVTRAVLRDAPVLVLDEPATGLDALASRRIVELLRCLMAGRTTIVITHDLDLAPDADADRILVIDQGRITATGRHDELLALGSTYAHPYGSRKETSAEAAEPLPPTFAAPPYTVSTGPEGYYYGGQAS